MIEDIVLNGNQEIRTIIEDKSDPYDYYYSTSIIGGIFENYESLKINNEKIIYRNARVYSSLGTLYFRRTMS
jgi:hypothetical protein